MRGPAIRGKDSARYTQGAMTDSSPRRPWKRDNPKRAAGETSAKMTQAEVAEARTRAELAGRRYPNLIDNMAVVRKRKAKSPS